MSSQLLCSAPRNCHWHEVHLRLSSLDYSIWRQVGKAWKLPLVGLPLGVGGSYCGESRGSATRNTRLTACLCRALLSVWPYLSLDSMHLGVTPSPGFKSQTCHLFICDLEQIIFPLSPLLCSFVREMISSTLKIIW